MDFGMALAIRAMGKAMIPCAEKHFYVFYPAEDVFDAVLLAVDKTEQFMLNDRFHAERIVKLKTGKTHRSGGEEIEISIEAMEDAVSEIFMHSKSLTLENDYGKNRENLEWLDRLIMDELAKLDEDDVYRVMRMERLGLLTAEQSEVLLRMDQWLCENKEMIQEIDTLFQSREIDRVENADELKEVIEFITEVYDLKRELLEIGTEKMKQKRKYYNLPL